MFLIYESMSNYSSLLYANALDEDFCIYRVMLWSKCFANMCSSCDLVDLMAAIIIVHSRNSLFDEMSDYHKKLSAWVERARTESIVPLVSISARCGCKEKELKILDKLAIEKKLSETLLN